jgi:hypothetical protein
MISVCLTLGLSSCASAVSEFCLLTDPLQPRNEEVAVYLFDNDRALVKKLVKHNKLREERGC